MRAKLDTLYILFFYLCCYLQPKFKTRAQLERWHAQRALKHLSRITKKSPFYKKWLAASPLSAWQQAPLTDKKIMMDNFTELNTAGIKREDAFSLAFQAEESRDFSPTINGITVGLSSGTSGNRGIFLASHLERMRYMGTILAKVLPDPIWVKQRVAFFLRANSNLYSSAGRGRIQFEFFDLLGKFEEHVKNLNTFQATIIFGPPSLLRKLAQAKVKGELTINPKRIFSVAEVLDPLDQAYMERIFEQKIHQIYQCTEGFLAHTCSEGVLHLNEDLVFFQKEWISREERKFYPVLTDLRRFTQPIIRYRLNDILTERAELCACGSIFTALECIEGRSDDILQFHGLNKENVDIYPDFIRRAVMAASPDIEEYLVRQFAVGTLQISLRAPLDKLEEIEKQVRNQVVLLAEKIQADIPAIEFNHKFSELGLKKLRRVERVSQL